MPSALRAGLTSTPRNCDRKPTKPTAAPTKAIASVATMVARSHPRGRAAGPFGDVSSDGKLMWFWWSSPHAILEGFWAKWSPVWRYVLTRFLDANRCPLRSKTLWLLDIIQRGEQRSPRGPGRNCGDQHRLRRQRQIARRTQRECPEQGCELIADRRAGEPTRNRFGEAKTQHCNAAADQPAFEAEPEKM